MSREEHLRDIESELEALIRRVRRVLVDRTRAVHPDLQPAALLVLGHVLAEGPVRAVDLAQRVDMDKAGVSRHVAQLVELGLLERRPDPDDRRAQLLVATPLAEDRVAAMRRARSARFGERLSAWSDAELADFADHLARYNAALGPRD